MKDVQATIRRLDEEIVGHKQQIAMHQVEIARLQDTRNVLMQLAESDIARAEASRADSAAASLIAGQHAKPVLIVRPTGSGEEPTKTVHARAKGQTKAEKPRKQRKSRPGSESAEFRDKIMKLMDDTPMTSREIGDHLGLPRDEMARKPMSNALYQLKVKGMLIRDAENRYARPQ